MILPCGSFMGLPAYVCTCTGLITIPGTPFQYLLGEPAIRGSQLEEAAAAAVALYFTPHQGGRQ